MKIKNKCELCDEREIEYIARHKDNGLWENICPECCDIDYYGIEIEDFFASPKETLDWLNHLNGKNWFTAQDFFNCITRLWRHSKGMKSMKKETRKETEKSPRFQRTSHFSSNNSI